MNTLAPWQRTLYFLGEALMVGGLLWGLYHKVFIGGCPFGPFNFLTILVVGLALSTIPLHPFGERRYFNQVLRRTPAAAVLLWIISLAGIGCSLYLTVQGVAAAGYWWILAIVPAFLFFWFAIPSKLTDRPVPPGRAPQPPADENDTDTVNGIDDDKEDRGTDA